jgi:hypothetical protein
MLNVTAYHLGKQNSGDCNCIIKLQHNWAFESISTSEIHCSILAIFPKPSQVKK